VLRSSIYYGTQSFCNLSQSFYYSELDHFSTVLSYFSELGHSAIVNLAICYSAKSFCYSKIRHYCYSELSHFIIVLSHFMILLAVLKILSDILLQCSIILAKMLFHFREFCHSSYYSAQLFSTELQCSAIFAATVLMHHRYYHAQSF
jgi:hypothetical protein